jgi:hypothetical protein
VDGVGVNRRWGYLYVCAASIVFVEIHHFLYHTPSQDDKCSTVSSFPSYARYLSKFPSAPMNPRYRESGYSVKETRYMYMQKTAKLFILLISIQNISQQITPTSVVNYRQTNFQIITLSLPLVLLYPSVFLHVNAVARISHGILLSVLRGFTFGDY